MSAVAFDTLTAARDLEAAGIERRQAEAIAGTVRTAAAADREALATKADLAELRADMKAEIAELATKADLKAEIAELRADMKAGFAETATKADLASVRAEIGTVRWAVGLTAAFIFAIGLRVFGLI